MIHGLILILTYGGDKMDVYTCLDKERDTSGSIKRILLQAENGEKRWVSKDRLKALMNQGRIQVLNLRIDPSGKLIDTQSNIQNNKSQDNRENRRISDEETLRLLKALEATSKESDARIIKILRELYIRQNELSAKIDAVLENPDDSSNQMDMKLNSLANYLVDNVDQLKDIKDKLTQLSQTITNKKQNTDDPDKTSIIKSESNGYPKPENTYELARCESSFMFGRNSLASSNDIHEINMDLNRLYTYINEEDEDPVGAFIGNTVPMELITKLRDEIDKANLAYRYTKEEFENELNTIIGMHTDLGLLSVVYGTVSDKINDIPGFIGETATGRSGVLSGLTMKKFGYAIKDLSLSIAGIIPGINEYAIRDKRQAIRFREKKQLSPAQANDLKEFTDGMWNDAARFILNDPEWEIKLFVIQFLTKQYTGKYKVTGKSNIAIQSNEGKQINTIDSSMTDKYSNKLTEVMLTKLCDYILEGRISDRYYIEACNRFFIAYFAAKKVIYSYGLYPFDKTATAKTNGVFIDTLRIGCLMLNVNQGTIDGIIDELLNAPDKDRKIASIQGNRSRYSWTQTTFSDALGI